MDALGVYLLVRLFVRDLEDMERMVKVLVVVCVVVALAMLNEQVTQRNLFSILGVGEVTIQRDGNFRIRGQRG